MDNKMNEEYTIDLMQLLKVFWRKAWLIALSGIWAAVIGFLIAAFLIKPTYSSSILLYVNNRAFSLGNTSFSISSGDISASASLVKTYTEILDNRTTLERVIEETGVPYTAKELSKKIVAGSANGTEIMQVTVTTEDPNEAALIANAIADILPERVAEIINGATMMVVDTAVPNHQKVAPSVTKYTALGCILGVILAMGGLVIFVLLDDTIHDEEFILQNFDYPILAKVPDLLNSGNKHYGYYYQGTGKSQSK
jgi:capsular polysaccharide biosynthesis protein